RAQPGAQSRAGDENVESKTLSTRRRQETRRDGAAIWGERRDRVGKSNSLVRVSAISNGERPPHGCRDKQRASHDGWRHRHVYPGEVARRQKHKGRGQRVVGRIVPSGRRLTQTPLQVHKLQPKTNIELAAVMRAATGETGDCAFDLAYAREITPAIRATVDEPGCVTLRKKR